MGLFVQSGAYMLAVPGAGGTQGVEALADLPSGAWRMLSNGSEQYLAVAFQSSYTCLLYTSRCV